MKHRYPLFFTGKEMIIGWTGSRNQAVWLAKGMSNGEWTFFASESQEVCLPEPWDGFLKVDFLPMQEPGPGTGRPICIFYQLLSLYVPARVIPLKETHEGFPRPAYILNLLSLCLRALSKNTSDIHECISMDKNLNSLLNHNNHTYSSTCNHFCPLWVFLWNAQFLNHSGIP